MDWREPPQKTDDRRGQANQRDHRPRGNAEPGSRSSEEDTKWSTKITDAIVSISGVIKASNLVRAGGTDKGAVCSAYRWGY